MNVLMCANQENLIVCLDQFWAFIQTQKQRILALWQIKRSHINLYDDMYLLIKQNFMEHAKRRNRPGNLEYQAHTYAILVLNVLLLFAA